MWYNQILQSVLELFQLSYSSTSISQTLKVIRKICDKDTIMLPTIIDLIVVNKYFFPCESTMHLKYFPKSNHFPLLLHKVITKFWRWVATNNLDLVIALRIEKHESFSFLCYHYQIYSPLKRFRSFWRISATLFQENFDLNNENKCFHPLNSNHCWIYFNQKKSIISK